MSVAYHGSRIDVHHHFYAPEYLAVVSDKAYGLKPEDLGAIYRGNAERLLPRFALTAAK